MNIAQRFTLMIKGNLNAVFDSLEDPERSLHQLVLDMGEELEAAKQATARAMANEDRLRQQVKLHEKDVAEWQKAAERSVAKGNDSDAREALVRAERADRQRAALRARLAEQAAETEQVREGVVRMERRLQEARGRLEVVQAQLRQTEARKAIGSVMRKVEATSLHAEFDRLSERVAVDAATERAYQQLDAEMSGDDLRRHFEEEAIDDAVTERLATLKSAAQPEGDQPTGAQPAEAQPAEDVEAER